jgi:hypothetical protein
MASEQQDMCAPHSQGNPLITEHVGTDKIRKLGQRAQRGSSSSSETSSERLQLQLDQLQLQLGQLQLQLGQQAQRGSMATCTPTWWSVMM